MRRLMHVLGSRGHRIPPSFGRFAAIGLFAVLVATRSDYAQELPQFKGGTNITRVIVRVLDKNRRPVRDLKAEDFTVLVNGTIRKIDAVVAEDAEGPLVPSAPWMREVAPDVATNELENPRLLVLILDDVAFGGVSGDPWTLRETKAIASNIVDALGPKDLVAVVFTGDNRQPQDFTSDRARIRDAIERFHDISVPGQLGTRYRLNTLSAAIGFLKTVPDKRSAILWITGNLTKGSYTPTRAPLPGNPSSQSAGETDEQLTLHQRVSLLLDEANLARIPVYPIHNIGFQTPRIMPDGTVVTPAFAASDFLLEIARATGGHAIVNTNSPRASVPTIFAELSLHYIVGYEASAPTLDGRFQRVQIQVNRKGVTVEPAEVGYYNPTPKSVVRETVAATGAATTVAMSGIIPMSDERLRLTAMPIGPDASRPGLAAVGFAVGVVVPRADGFAPGDVLDSELRIFDGEGRREIEVRRQTADVPASANRDADFAIDLLLSTSLKPGRYNIRASVHSKTRDRSGSVYTDVVIPDFRKAPLSVSAVLWASENSRATPRELLSTQVPVVPTTIRTLTQGQRPTAFVRVFSAGGKRANAVSVRVTIRDATDRVVFEQVDDLALQDLEPNVKSAEYRFIPPSAALKPGEYVLTMSVASSTRDVIRRDVRFSVN